MKTKSLLIGLLCFIVGLCGIAQEQAQEQKWSNTPIQVKNIDAQKALIMKADIPMSEISEKMGEIYQTVFTYIQQNNIVPAGPAFAVYYSYEPEGNIVFEAGVPVTEKQKGTDDILYKEYEEMKAATTLYKGSYEAMEPVYGKMQQYMVDNKLEFTGISWEVYLTDPSMVTDPSMNQTLIYFPVK